MSDINFLTDSFVREQTRRARAGRELVLIGVVVLVMCGWGLMSWRQMVVLRRELAMRNNEATSLTTQSEQFIRLTAQNRELARQVALQQEMALPLDVSAVIATIVQLAPDSLTVTSMTLSTPKPRPTKSVVSAESSKKQKKKKSKRSSSDQQRVLKINLSGVCPLDADVVDFVDNLTAHKLFASVKLAGSRYGSVLSVAVREFQIEMQVPLDRLYIPSNEAHKGMADAS